MQGELNSEGDVGMLYVLYWPLNSHSFTVSLTVSG